MEYLKQRNVSRPSIFKDMTIFLWNELPYIIESYDFEEKRIDVLRSITSDRDASVVPNFLVVDKDITEDEAFFTRNLR